MNRFWPKNIGDTNNETQKILETLQSAAKEITFLTEGKIRGEISSFPNFLSKNSLTHTFSVYVSSINYYHRLFTINQNTLQFPLTIEFEGSKLVCHDLDNLENSLRKIFSYEKTMKTIGSLLVLYR